MRPNLMAWENEEQAEGVLSPFGGEEEAKAEFDASPSLLGMPTHSNIKRNQDISPDADVNAKVREVLEEIAGGLSLAVAENKATRIELDDLTPEERTQLFDALGEGEVLAVVTGAEGEEADARLQETILAGVWRGEAASADGALTTYWIEVADLPRVVRRVAAERSILKLDLEAITPPPGAMNVMAILSELDERSLQWKPGEANHVMNFTLFPMTPADSSFLSKTVGEVGLQIISGGYGIARIIKTGVPHVWAVQYLNGMGTTILDTLEVGDAPACALASSEDFQDSAERLAEISEAYS